ncbi:MAG TPA: class I SAM-dependent methyltransferase, partial [Pyrinomonadaceae bacterium]|nr:class I SAM-dependent methyltransferase [Pyrinomonadaceae bacterium]
VELGVDRGTSYCTFCQAVKELGTGTKTFGVDTWQGDEHAGKRSDEVYSKLREHHDPRYSSFSKLVRSTFDEALPTFADGSVDLLHIDGFHTYDAVRHDLETWLPKVSNRGIVLFHDTMVRDRDFGVWKFFKEVSKSRPSFEFQHSHGLGVLSVGGEVPEAMRAFFEADEAEREVIRKFFETLGDRFDSVVRYQIQMQRVGELESYAAIVKDSALLSSYHRARRGLGRFYRRARGRN